jgi:hypothetical protein
MPASAIAVLWLTGIAGDGFAQSVDTDWRAETRLYLTGMANYQQINGTSASYDYLATTTELRFTSNAKPWYTSLYADYRFSTVSRFTDQVNLGGLFKYSRYKWDATTYLFVNQSPRTDDTWLYAGRFRYRIAENHKIGIEAIGTLKYSDSPQLMLGYYGSISDSLSLNFAAGPVAGNDGDFSARLELIWRVF